MNTVEDREPEPVGDDLVAAEYVLGVLSAEDRTAAGLRVEREHDFARLVEVWEAQLFPISSGYAAVEPPAALKAALDRRLFSNAATARPASGGLWSNLAFGADFAAAAFAALALYILIPMIDPPATTPQSRLVASLGAEGSDVRYVAVFDAAGGDVALSHVSGERASGQDFELWMIAGNASPVSMGVIPVGSTAHITIDAAGRVKLAQGAVLAVSLEPAGGSPTGQPTGPVVAAGDLKSI